jgi:hypothetical protein
VVLEDPGSSHARAGGGIETVKVLQLPASIATTARAHQAAVILCELQDEECKVNHFDVRSFHPNMQQPGCTCLCQVDYLMTAYDVQTWKAMSVCSGWQVFALVC